MMKSMRIRLLTCTAIALSSIVNPIQAQADVAAQTYNGPTTLNDQSGESVEVMGPLNGENLKIKNLNVHGPLNVKNFNGTSLTVYGPANIDSSSLQDTSTIQGPLTTLNSAYKGDVVVYGPVEATGTKFEAILTINADQTTLTGVTADRVLVKDTKTGKQQNIKVRTTKINQITFESDKGFVDMDEGSEIKIIKGGQLLNCRNRALNQDTDKK